MKARCLTYLEHKIELHDIHFAAAMLNPNYRTLRQATKAEQTPAQKFLRRRIEMTKKSTTSEQSSRSNNSDDDNRHYLSKYSDNPPTTRKQDELTRYLKSDHHETNSNDILELCSTMANSSPKLAKVTFQILTVPARSANLNALLVLQGKSFRRGN